MKAKKKPSRSLLTRLFKNGKKKNNKGRAGANPKSSAKKATEKVATAAAKEKPLTPRQRSIAEIKQMKSLGDKSPERLARILAAMLSKERAKNEADKDYFDQMIQGIIQRSEKVDEEEGDSR